MWVKVKTVALVKDQGQVKLINVSLSQKAWRGMNYKLDNSKLGSTQQWTQSNDALMMHSWCADDAPMMRWWCADDALMMHWWCMFDTWEYGFCYRWTILSSKIYHMLGLSGTSSMLYLCLCVFCICIFVFACLTHGNIIFDILEQSSFQKYATWWVFTALLICCICVFVYLYLCICVWDTW